MVKLVLTAVAQLAKLLVQSNLNYSDFSITRTFSLVPIL